MCSLRFLDETRKESQPAKQPRNHDLIDKQRELMLKDSLLLQATVDYDPLKMPTVVLHHQGESNAGTSSCLCHCNSHDDTQGVTLKASLYIYLNSGRVHYQRSRKQHRGGQRSARHPVATRQHVLNYN